jgi:hypothetical protein
MSPLGTDHKNGRGAVGDKYQILNIFRAVPDRKTFIFKAPPPASRKFRTRPPPPPQLQHLIRYIFWCKLGKGQVLV